MLTISAESKQFIEEEVKKVGKPQIDVRQTISTLSFLLIQEAIIVC
jgi:hypothetical protein